MYKMYIIVILCFTSLNSLAQSDTGHYYLSKAGYYLKNKDSAEIDRIVTKPKAADEKLFLVHDKYLNGYSKLISHSKNSDGSVLQGYTIEFYRDGKKRSEENFVDDVLAGPINVYFPNGRLFLTGTFSHTGMLLISQYRDSVGHVLATDGTGEAAEYDDDMKNITASGRIQKSLKEGIWTYFNNNKLWYTIRYRGGKMLAGVGYDSVGKEHPFMQFEEVAQFKKPFFSLYEHIYNKLKYNNTAKKAGVRGSVHVTFCIEKDGSLTNVKVTEGLGYGLDEEALRLINLTSDMWLPARQFGLPIRSNFNIAINFGLETNRASFKLSQH